MSDPRFDGTANLVWAILHNNSYVAEACLTHTLAKRSLTAIDTMKTQIVKTISEDNGRIPAHPGVRYIVGCFNGNVENTLGYIYPEQYNAVGILAGSVLKGGPDPLTGSIDKGQLKGIRPATKQDFVTFRVQPPRDLFEESLPSTQNNSATEARIRKAAKQQLHLSDQQIQTAFEHGHWWVIDKRTGASWDAVDTDNGFDFEEIDGGDEDY